MANEEGGFHPLILRLKEMMVLVANKTVLTPLTPTVDYLLSQQLFKPTLSNRKMLIIAVNIET